MTAVNFNEDLFELLAIPSDIQLTGSVEFPEWDVLKEIDRQERRRRYDKKRSETRRLTRRYIENHPEVVEKLG